MMCFGGATCCGTAAHASSSCTPSLHGISFRGTGIFFSGMRGGGKGPAPTAGGDGFAMGLIITTDRVLTTSTAACRGNASSSCSVCAVASPGSVEVDAVAMLGSAGVEAAAIPGSAMFDAAAIPGSAMFDAAAVRGGADHDAATEDVALAIGTDRGAASGIGCNLGRLGRAIMMLP